MESNPTDKDNHSKHIPYKVVADKLLPILVRQAKDRMPITYRDLNIEAGIGTSQLGKFLGYIGKRLITLGDNYSKDIPPIQCLVVNSKTRLPGEGIGWFLQKEAQEEFSKFSIFQQRKIVDEELAKIYRFQEWNWVLEQFNLKPIKLKPEVKQLLNKSKEHTGGGESQQHKAFKEYIAQNPKKVGLKTSIRKGEVEYSLPSQDEIDVMFVDGDLKIGVEVKSKISDTPDILRGLFQCVKYQYLLEAEQAVTDDNPNCRMILALENAFPEELTSIKNILGIEVVDKISIE